jgi:hypothetical protein
MQPVEQRGLEQVGQWPSPVRGPQDATVLGDHQIEPVGQTGELDV